MFSLLAALPTDARISQNLFINGVDVGKMTREAAGERLYGEISLAAQRILVICGDEEYAYSFGDFGADYDIEAALDEALRYSHDGGFFAKLRRGWTLRFNEHHIKTDFIYAPGKIAQIAEEIAGDFNTPVAEPTYAIRNGAFEIAEGHIGREVSAAGLATDIETLLLARTEGKLTAHVTETHPKYDSALFHEARNLLGSYATPFNPHLAERTTNIAVASAFLDNQVIMPGQIFSTSAALRERNAENGYVMAGQIVNGEPDAGIGGGICQISSTLYMAALYAEIPVPERRNHSLMVGYMAPGTDAALAEGHIDLKLQNNSGHPMLIQSALQNGRHIVNIYGHESRAVGRHISFESTLLEIVPPDMDKIIEDPLLPPGYSQIVSEGLVGAKYELYKVIMENGEMQRVKVNTSTYRPLQRVVKVGVVPEQ